MRRFNPRMVPDTVQVYPYTDSTDVDGGPTRITGTPTTFAASVQRVTGTGNATKWQEPYQGAIAGAAYYDILFTTDPTAIVNRAGVTIVWTAHNGQALPKPVTLVSQGAAEPPGGLMSRWTVSAVRRS